MKVGRNDICPCGSGLKYKKCCMKTKSTLDTEKKEFSVSEIISFLKNGLKNINAVNKEVENISVKEIKLLNGKTLECQFYALLDNSIDVKTEISSVMGVLHGFFKDDSFENMRIDYYAVRAYDKSDNEIMYAISSKESASLIGNGNSIEWLKSTIFQENTKDYRLAIAKRQISDIENALRKVIISRLSVKHGSDWFKKSLGNKLFQNVKGVYENQFGEEIEDGNVLIEYTFVLQLKKIICTNWKDFSDLFESKIKFEDYIVELNEIRREEAHNRDVSVKDLDRLKIIYEFMLIEVTEKFPDIIPSYLIDNWKIQLKEIMHPKIDLPYSDSEVLNESNQQLKLIKSVANIQGLINHIQDKEEKLKSVLVPVLKRKIHNELLDILLTYRTLHEELLECGKTGVLSVVVDKQNEIDEYTKKLNEFAEKYVFEES
ncbi:MAG: YecA family protein [Marinifilaceae bacterium]